MTDGVCQEDRDLPSYFTMEIQQQEYYQHPLFYPTDLRNISHIKKNPTQTTTTKPNKIPAGKQERQMQLEIPIKRSSCVYQETMSAIAWNLFSH